MIYFVVVRLLHPYTWLVVGLVAWVVWCWCRSRMRTRALVFVTVPVAGLLVFSLPILARGNAGLLEGGFPAEPGAVVVPDDAHAIVVLAAGVHAPVTERGRTRADATTTERCLMGAAIRDRAGGGTILVSGGKVDPGRRGETAAEVMRDLLVGIGVPDGDVIVEDRSRDTWENAVESAAELRRRGIEHVVLVTSGVHLPRAIRCFERQGLTVTPVAATTKAQSMPIDLFAFLPRIHAASVNQECFHEWIGFAWYRLRGRL